MARITDVDFGDAEFPGRFGEIDDGARTLVLRNSCHQLIGSFQPQMKKEYHGTSRMRPRTASTDTYTLGPYSAFIGTLMVGSWPDSCTTRVSMTPSRSTATRAVA
jgi:hypothetical protein